MHFVVKPSAITGGALRVPGDKSISHRALLLGAIADGETEITGFLPGADCLATLGALTQLGVRAERVADDHVRVNGVGLHGLQAPKQLLDLGNSGTAMRLMTGMLASQRFDTTLIGDPSLSSRPMARVIDPLVRMGARIGSAHGKPPLTISGNRTLHGVDYALPVASAQVKSALLLAGLYAEGDTVIREPAVTRDHTERMLRAMGAAIDSGADAIRLSPGATLQGRQIAVPTDLSSATFPLLAALLADDARLTLRDVGINPTRDGVLAILRDMGAELRIVNERRWGDEPIGDIEASSSSLKGITLDPRRVSLAIDEFPALFVAAACASGTTTFSGLGELRLKESDRIAVMARGLKALGIHVEESGDGARITGGRLSGGDVDSGGDHRIAMAFAVAATRARGPLRIRDVAAVGTSFPGFARSMRALGMDISAEDDK